MGSLVGCLVILLCILYCINKCQTGHGQITPSHEPNTNPNRTAFRTPDPPPLSTIYIPTTQNDFEVPAPNTTQNTKPFTASTPWYQGLFPPNTATVPYAPPVAPPRYQVSIQSNTPTVLPFESKSTQSRTKVECPVCFENKIPVMLRCGTNMFHSVCQDCLNKMQISNTKYAICPLCRKESSIMR